MSDPERLKGLKGQRKSEGRENSAKFSDHKYIKYSWNDYKHREVKMGWTITQLFPKLQPAPGKKKHRGSDRVMGHYHFRADPDLQLGTVAV